MRERTFGDAVFLYGFVYFSTYCRNECTFCFYRADNDESPRYRKSADEVVAICRDLAASGVVLLDLTMGEDPLVLGGRLCAACSSSWAPFTTTPACRSWSRPASCPTTSSPGCGERGADWYALYQETHTRELYERLRVGQPYEARAAARRAARRAGLLVEDGLLTGIGDSAADRAHSIATMRAEACEQVRVMTFVPQAGHAARGRPSRGATTRSC